MSTKYIPPAAREREAALLAQREQPKAVVAEVSHQQKDPVNQQQTEADAITVDQSQTTKTTTVGSSETPHSVRRKDPSHLRVVEIDALVLMKIQKYCRNSYPSPVNGQLLGMDTDGGLEVTNCFPLPQKKDIYISIQKEKSSIVRDVDERVEEEFERYQEKMAELMHDVNVDCFTVGWYQTLSFGDLKSKENIDNLVTYQELVDKAIMLGYDPLLSSMGKMAFKAFRVSDEFRSKYHQAEEDVSNYNKLKSTNLLIEVPIFIKTPLLVEAYLLECCMNDPLVKITDFDALELDQNNYLEKNLNFLSQSLDYLSDEQERLIKYQRDSLKQQQLQKQITERRRLENEQRHLRGENPLPLDFEGPAFRKIEPPSQISTLLMCNQAALQCKEINNICSENITKMFLLHRGNVPH